jgi:hopene-associated glycosyltransferase HpnB
MLALVIGIISLTAWIFLLFGRGLFWLERAAGKVPKAPRMPAVTIIVPARNESEVVQRTMESLLQQDYEGRYQIILVDDHSADETAAKARMAAELMGKEDLLSIVQAPPLASGWSGKLWALHTGIQHAAGPTSRPQYVLFTDADILHPAHSLTQLVALAETGDAEGFTYDLVSLMVRLNCRSIAEKLMVPAFVFFFQMLYPFRRARNPKSPVAAGAGGVMLVRWEAMERMGGVPSIRNALIDDCALAAAIKRTGSIWIGLSKDTISLRSHQKLSSLWNMIARTAFTQLRYSALMLLGTIVGMFVTFVVPPLLLLTGWSWAAALGAASWILMILAYYPTVHFYGLNPLWAAALPLKAFLYAGATLDSALRYWQRRGGPPVAPVRS